MTTTPERRRAAHEVPRTTHTVELDQVELINAYLRRVDRLEVAALDPQNDPELAALAQLGPSSTLVRVEFEGSPRYPYVYGVFTTSHGMTRLPLHTPQLRSIADRLHLRGQRWGV